METTPEGAFLIFEKWHTNGTELLCESVMIGWGFVFKGRVVSVSRDEVLITSGDKLARLGLSFRTTGLEFVFGLNDESVPAGALIVVLPLRVHPSDLADASFVPRRDKLSFLSLDTPISNAN